MTAKPFHAEISAYAAGAAVGAIAMLLALLPHTRFDVAAAPTRMSTAQAEVLQAPSSAQSLYAAAKIGLPPRD